ncbi:MAG: GGDEF domain-containing protein [Gammaproteobacteria bacterium]
MVTLMESARALLDSTGVFTTARLFESVAPDSIEPYLQQCEVLEIDAGEVLLTPKSTNLNLYILTSGGLEVRLDSLDQGPLTRISPGECVGEMSMIEGCSPSAFVVASVPSQVLAISRELLWAMVGASHAIARNLLVILSGRLRTDNAIIADSAVIIRHFQKKSFTDALTGLNNRRWMEDYFTRELARCQTERQSAVMALVDIDHFSVFNNQFGHLVGDMALGAVAEVLTARFRTGDMVARHGGDEFAILLPNIDLDGARSIVERVRAGLVKASDRLATSVPDCVGITVSVGIAVISSGDSLETLMSRADKALYRAKEKGRNKISD